MQQTTVPALVLAAALAPVAVMALANDIPVVHDDPMLMLDANYHDLPKDLVAKLRANPPKQPYGLFIDEACYTHDSTWPRADVEYCVCWTEKGCAELIRWKCGAKLGALSWTVGVCRARLERVVVTG